MPLVAKHLDFVVGVDIHITILPPPATPLPLPYPFMAMIFDPMDWVPMIGATVKVNNMPRAVASTQGMLAVPPLHHIPWGPGFLLEPMMGNDQKMFFGGAKTHAEGALLSAGPYMVMSCNDIGMPLSIKPGKNWKPIPSLYLPLSCSIPLPMGPPVNLNDPLVPDWSSMAKDLLIGAAFGYAMKGAGAALTRFNHFLKGVLGESNVISRGLCVLKFEPVDVVRGNVVAYEEDFELPGPIPFKWERQYSSNATYFGPIGARWSTQYTQYMQYNPADASFEWLTADGRRMLIPDLPFGEQLFIKSERCSFYFDEEGLRYFNHKARLWFHFRNVTIADSHHYKLVRINNENIHSIAIKYSANGSVERIIDSAGRNLLFTNNANGLIRTINLDGPGERSLLVNYDYDGLEDLTAITDATGKSISIKYDNHLMVEKTDRSGDTFYWRYNGTSSEAKCIDTFGKDNLMRGHIEYEADRTIIFDALKNQSTFIHARGLVVEEIDSFGFSKTYVYNESMELIEQADEMGRKTLYAYDFMGNRIAASMADGSKTALQFNEHGLPILAMDGSGRTSIYNYDAENNLVQVINADKRVVQYEYEFGLPKKITTPTGEVFLLSYDAHYNLMQLSNLKGKVVSWEYDYKGRIISQEKPGGTIERYQYDNVGRLRGLVKADGNHISFDYGGYDDVLVVKDRLAKVEMEYNSLGRLTRRVQAGREMRFFYDQNNRLTSVKNELGESYYFKYSSTGKVIQETGFDGQVRQYVRNPAGEVVTIVKPGGRLVNFQYDGVGRVLDVQYDDGYWESFAYDGAGRMIDATNEATSVQFIRDEGGHIVKEIQDGKIVSRDYSRLGRPNEIKSGLGAFINFGYEDNGNLIKMSGITGASKWQAQLLNDINGFEMKRFLPGDVILQHERSETGQPLNQRLYRGSDQLYHKTYSWGAGNRLQNLGNVVNGIFTSYQYDGAGNLTASIRSDSNSMMPEITVRAADDASNYYRRDDKSDRVYGPGGRLLSTQEARFEYNQDGSLASKIGREGIWRYDYYANGLLRSVIRPDNLTVSFVYDAIGRRIAKKFNSKVTRWLWDGNVPLHEWEEQDTSPSVDASGNIVEPERANLVTWIFEPESFIPCAKITEQGTYSIITDQAGTPACMVDDTGRKIWEGETDIYGATKTVLGFSTDMPFRNQGQYEDIETGLYYNRFRYYAPVEGIYISQDPIRLKGGSRLYSYSPNPLKYLDVLGLTKCKVTEVDAATHDLEITISRSDYPETAGHIQDAIDAGHPDIVTIDRLGAKENRAESLAGIPTKPGFDRDEWPMAMFKEGGSGASVRYITPSDNRGAGSAIGNALSDYPPETIVKILIID